jgi:hypothetical protein
MTGGPIQGMIVQQQSISMGSNNAHEYQRCLGKGMLLRASILRNSCATGQYLALSSCGNEVLYSWILLWIQKASIC